MKENNKRVVFYSAEKDGFLESYKDRGSLVFKAVFDDRLWKALQLPIEFYEKQKNELDKLSSGGRVGIKHGTRNIQRRKPLAEQVHEFRS